MTNTNTTLFFPFSAEKERTASEVKGKTYFDIEKGRLIYKGHHVYLGKFEVWEETPVGKPYTDTFTVEGSCEGSTWDKTESYKYETSFEVQEYEKTFKGLNVKFEDTKFGYKEYEGGSDWLPLFPENFNDLVFINNTPKVLLKNTKYIK